MGASLAYELVTKGVDVVLVDRHHAGKATDAGAGILSPETFLDPDDAWAELAVAAGVHHRDLNDRVADDGAGGTGYDTCGLAKVAMQEAEDEWVVKATEIAERRTPGIVTTVDFDEVRRMFPPIGRVRSGIYSPVAARIDGRLATSAISLAAAGRGLRIVDAEATSLEIAGNRVTAVVTSDGKVATGALAIAGGAWSSKFAAHLRSDLKVFPMKGQIVHMRVPGADTSRWAIVQPIMSHYLVPWPDGRVVCGGTLEAEAGFDPAPTAGGIHELFRECLKTAPGLATATFVEVRVGLRPASSDGRPVLGRLPGWSNVHVATGHGTEGLLMGPYTSALVAEGIVAGSDPKQIEDLSPARFVES